MLTYDDTVRIAELLRQSYDPRVLTYEQVARFCELALRSAWRDKMSEEERHGA